MLLLAFSDDPHRTVLRQLPPPLISLLIGLLLFLIIQMYEDERRTCFIMKKNIHKKMLSNRMNVY